MIDQLYYSDLNACTAVPDTNSSYLVNQHYASIQAPLSSPTMGLMMILSAFQYEAPYVNPVYSNAMTQATKAAYIQGGGQALQDKMANNAGKSLREVIHSIGVTDAELAIVIGSAKVLRSRQIDINGPKINSIRTHLSANQTSGSIGIGWDFK